MSILGCSPRFHWFCQFELTNLEADAHNFRFAGTQVGWIGEMSVPITSALGY